MIPKKHDVIHNVMHFYDLTMNEALELFGEPMNPRGLRDDFATSVMQFYLQHYSPEEAVVFSYKTADLMLKERNK